MANNNTQNFATLVTPVTSQALFEEYNRRPDEYTRIFNVLMSERNFEQDTQVVGLGAMPEKPEGTPVLFDRFIEGFQKTYTHVSYGLGYRITEEMQEDDLTGKIIQFSRALGTSGKQTIETVSADVFNNGFSATTGGDGVSLFNSAHPLKGGGTASNTLATAADLSATSLRDAIVQFEDTTDDQGIPLLQKVQTLVVPSANRWIAQELLKSRQKPGSADNDFNPLAEADIGWMPYRYLTDTDAWFLIGDLHFLKFFWRRQPKLSSTMDFDSGDAKFKLTMRFDVSHSDWRGTFGVAGA